MHQALDESAIGDIRVYYKKVGHILKPLVSKCCADMYIYIYIYIYTHLRDIAEKQVPAELKLIAACSVTDAKHYESRCIVKYGRYRSEGFRLAPRYCRFFIRHLLFQWILSD